MRQFKTYRVYLLALLAITAALGGSRRSYAEGAEFLSIGLSLGDTELLPGDGVPYMVTIHNLSKSTVMIAGPRVKPAFSCVIEHRGSGGEWRAVWDEVVHGRDRDVVPAPLRISAGSSWVEYGAVFFTSNKKKVFDEVGAYELRALVTTPLGAYRSEVVKVHVLAAPPGEATPGNQFDSLGRIILSNRSGGLERQFDTLGGLCKRHRSGGVAKSLKLSWSVENYGRTGLVNGRMMSRLEAFNALSSGLDAVRQDQLAFLLAREAERKENWNEVAELLSKIKTESSDRRSLEGELTAALEGAGKRHPE